MLNYIEFLETPTGIATILVAIFLIIQVVGEILEFKGKVVPEFVKIRKYFTRKKQEREIILQVRKELLEVKALLNNVEKHYNKDNIEKRNSWINWVNNKADMYDNGIAELEKKMDDNNEITLSLLVDSKRDAIIAFASKVVDSNCPVTREQFNRIFKIYKEYENIINEHGITNGEVDVAIRIIDESYEEHTRNHSFIEDVRKYNS